MKKNYRIYKSGNSWKIEQINWWGVVYELYMYGTGDITYKSFATKEEAQEVIDKHRRLAHKKVILSGKMQKNSKKKPNTSINIAAYALRYFKRQIVKSKKRYSRQDSKQAIRKSSYTD